MGRSQIVRKVKNSFRNSYRIISLLILTAVGIATYSQTKSFRNPSVSQKFDVRILQVDNSNRDGVTRVSCEIYGFPHTSNRIDEVILKLNGKESSAIDIDGVDFKRYFQWEDEGIIYLEIDFPKETGLHVADSICFMTLRGALSFPLGKFKVK